MTQYTRLGDEEFQHKLRKAIALIQAAVIPAEERHRRHSSDRGRQRLRELHQHHHQGES